VVAAEAERVACGYGYAGPLGAFAAMRMSGGMAGSGCSGFTVAGLILLVMDLMAMMASIPPAMLSHGFPLWIDERILLRDKSRAEQFIH
jgi:hypothetical protein